MLWFMYTDYLPGEDELADSLIEMYQNLLASADRYELDRMKFICAQMLFDDVSVERVATILAFAKTYNFPELKNKCIDFFVLEQNFKVMFTEHYGLLVLQFHRLLLSSGRGLEHNTVRFYMCILKAFKHNCSCRGVLKHW